MATSNSTTSRERCLIYLRTSDPTQSGDDSQLINARRLARTHQLEIVAEIEDEGESGDDMERPGLLEVLAILERERRRGDPIAWLLIDHSDRLSRADSLETSELLAKMRRFGVKWIATPGRIFDLYKAIDRTMLGIEADHKNNAYLKDRSRTILDGMLNTARLGFWTGAKPPLGYKVVCLPGEHGAAGGGQKKRRRSGRLAIDEATAPLVVEAFQRYRDGASTRDVRDWLSNRTGKTWSRWGVQYLLSQEIYTGTKAFGRRSQGKHAGLSDGQAVVMEDGKAGGDVVRISGFPALIDQELFLAVQQRLKRGRGRSQKKTVPVTALSGLCRCGVCGASVVSHVQKGYRYYRCARPTSDEGGQCSATHYMRGDEIFSRVLKTLADRLLAGDAVATLVALAGEAEDEAKLQWEKAVTSARKGLETCDARLATARRRLASADDDMVEEYQRIIRDLKAERVAVEADLKKLLADEPVPQASDAELLTRWLESCRRLCGGERPDDPAAVNALLKELVAEVRTFPPAKIIRGRQTVGRIEVVLPEWLSRVLSRAGEQGCQRSPGREQGRRHTKPIVLVSEA